MPKKQMDLGSILNLKGKKAEELVQVLAQKSFLEDWCFKNPLLPNGKELCDLLVVYDNVAIIWQIKDLKLDKKGKYRIREVKRNIRQATTAKNRLFRKDLEIELENPRRGKEIFNSKDIEEVYLISALLGEGEDYYSFIEEHKSHIVHTFTREFTEIILHELDTIRDFIEYLRKKEEFLSWNKRLMITGGEEELLAYYLLNERSFESLKKPDVVILNEGIWNELQSKPKYLAKKEEDGISYGWDSIINRAHTSDNREYEIIARELARPNRFERRVLSKAFFEAHKQAHEITKANVYRRLLIVGDTTYCFLFYDDVEPRETRKAMLGQMCFVARGIYSENKIVIGIATEMKIRPLCSYDFCILEIPEWTEEQQKLMERTQKEFGIFINYKEKRYRENEYPQ